MADESLDPSVEIWKPVPGYPKYEASSLGRVRSSWGRGKRFVAGYVKYRRGIAVARFIDLSDGQVKRQVLMHRIILLAFVGPCPEGMECCHYDGNPLNNRIDNLRWDTHAENMRDCARHGTLRSPAKLATAFAPGSAHPNSKLSEDVVREIRATPLRRGTMAALARRFGVRAEAISRVLNRESWTHI